MKKALTLLLTLCMIASVCALPVSAASISFDAADIAVADAAKGIITVSSNLVDTVRENRYVTLIVVPNTVTLPASEANTLALATAIVDLNGDFFTSIKFTETTGTYDFYILYEGQVFGPVMYNFTSLTDAAAIIRNIASIAPIIVPKDSIIPQIKAANIGVDFTRFPEGFDEDLFVYRMDKARAEITGATDPEIITSVYALVDKIEDEIAFVKEVNNVTYSGDYLALLQNNVIHTGIDFTAYNNLDASLKSQVTDSFLGRTFYNGDEIKDHFDFAVANAASAPVVPGPGVGPGGITIVPENNDREWETTMPNNGEAVKVTFNDIADVAWAIEAIEALATKNIVAGTSYGIFQPNGLVTREQFAKMLVLAANKYNPNAANTFTDIPAGNWSASYVASAKDAGYINGIGEGKFGYGASITREDMAVMIYKVMKANGTKFDNVNTSFADYAEISDYAKEAVGALTAKGIINGVGDNRFAPKATATRAQAALLIYAITKGVA